MLQPVMSFFEEGLGVKRLGSTAVMLIFTLLGTGFVVYRSKSPGGLDAIDFWSGELFIVILALVQSIMYGWVLGIDKGREELDDGARMRVPYFIQYVIKFVSPFFLICILVSMLMSRNDVGKFKILEKFAEPIQATGFYIIVGCLFILWIMVFFAGRRWKAEGKYDNLVD